MSALHKRAARHTRAEAGALCEKAGERALALRGRAGALGALHGRAALHERAGERAAALCGRAGALGAALHERAEVGALCEWACAMHETAGALSGRADALGWYHKIHHHYHILCTVLVISHCFSIHQGP